MSSCQVSFTVSNGLLDFSEMLPKDIMTATYGKYG